MTDVPSDPGSRARVCGALLAAVICHGSFLAAVVAMAVGLASGMQTGLGRMAPPFDLISNGLLVLQFPLIHSTLLTTRGRRILVALVPGRHGRTLAATTFATISSCQLLLLFLAWTPSGVVWWEPHGVAAVVAVVVFAGAWAFLVRALTDAGLGLQTGSLGWVALLRRRAPAYPPLPTGGVFRTCRQPIYFGFFLILWTAPTWTPDHLALAAAWTPYCLLAPRLKERRFLATYGAAFARYRERVPYFLPLQFLARPSDHANRGGR